jgi:RND family efflux transporter MFP subunit
MKISVPNSLRKGMIWAVAIVAAGLTGYWLKYKPVPVSVHPVTSEEVVSEVMGTGTLEARVQATVSAKIAGRIVELFVDQNDRVKQGQLVARLDDTELGQEVSVAKATLDTARATVERLKAEEARFKAVLEQAQRDYERYSALAASRSVSQETVEKSRERLSVAEADVAKAAAATIEGIRQATTVEERLRFEEARLSDTRIYSPFDGLVTRRDRETGDIVVLGTSIFQIISTREMWISAWVDESAMTGLKVGQPSRVVFRSEPGTQYKGNVARLGREVDRETREFRVDVYVNELPDNWAVGQRAEVYIEAARKSNVLAIPQRAVVLREGKPGVYIVDEGKAHWRELVLGVRGIEHVEIINGVTKNDFLIVGGESSQVADGQRVRVK